MCRRRGEVMCGQAKSGIRIAFFLADKKKMKEKKQIINDKGKLQIITEIKDIERVHVLHTVFK